MWLHIYVISTILTLVQANPVITSISGGYKDQNTLCKSAIVHFNTTSIGSKFHLYVCLDPRICDKYDSKNCWNYGTDGLCYLSIADDLIDGCNSEFRLTENLSNGTILKSPIYGITIHFADLYGPLINLSMSALSKGRKVKWSMNVKPSSSTYLNYEVCQRSLSAHLFEKCKSEKKQIRDMPSGSIACYKKPSSCNNICTMNREEEVHPNVMYKFRLRYSIGVFTHWSQWSEYAYYTTGNLDPPKLTCYYNSKGWTDLKWTFKHESAYNAYQGFSVVVFEGEQFRRTFRVRKTNTTQNFITVKYYNEITDKVSFVLTCPNELCASPRLSCRKVSPEPSSGDENEDHMETYYITSGLISFIAVLFIAISIFYIRQKRRYRFPQSESRVYWCDVPDLDDGMIAPYSIYRPSGGST